MPGFPFRAAVTDVASSGSDVPQATIVRPITASLTPNALAISDAPATKRSPPNISAASPPITNAAAFSGRISFTSPALDGTLPGAGGPSGSLRACANV